MIHLLDVNELKEGLKNDEFVLIDVREPDEYAESKIEGSILIPLGQISANDVEKANPEGKKIAIHCKLGGRSMRACQQLAAENPNLELYNVEGGITAWLNAGTANCGNSGSCSA